MLEEHFIDVTDYPKDKQVGPGPNHEEEKWLSMKSGTIFISIFFIIIINMQATLKAFPAIEQGVNARNQQIYFLVISIILKKMRNRPDIPSFQERMQQNLFVFLKHMQFEAKSTEVYCPDQKK